MFSNTAFFPLLLKYIYMHLISHICIDSVKCEAHQLFGFDVVKFIHTTHQRSSHFWLIIHLVGSLSIGVDAKLSSNFVNVKNLQIQSPGGLQ